MYSIHIGPICEANSNVQFILDPYVIASYYISYLTKMDKSIS